MTSSPDSVAPILWHFKANEYQKVFDVGMGYGKYGFLLREYKETPHGRFKLGDFKIRIDGLEPFHQAITFQKQIYDNIYFSDLENFIPFVQYDLMLWIDILEHMPKEESIKQFNRYKPFAKQHLIATPKTFIKQKLEVNEHYDQHRSLIKPFMLDKKFKRLDKDDISNYIYLIEGGQSEEKTTKKKS